MGFECADLSPNLQCLQRPNRPCGRGRLGAGQQGLVGTVAKQETNPT